MNWLRIQRRLKELGFDPGPLDGVRGPKTDAAVVAFKRAIGFRARPYVGPLTLEALFGKPAEDTADTGQLPWMRVAQKVRGLHEARDTATLRDWFHRSVAWIDPREIPWCGAFVATCIKEADPSQRVPENSLGARNWLKFGEETRPVFGAVMVFWRGSRAGWKGHVGFYHGEDEAAYHILGGNQSNAVTVTRIAKGRLLGARWPTGHLNRSRPIFVRPNGVPVSENEA